MKKVISIFILVYSLSAYSQRPRIDYLPGFDQKKLHYGFYLGLNNNSFKINYNPYNLLPPGTPAPIITLEESPGFNVGLIADLRINNNLNVRFEPGLMTNTKKLIFNQFVNDTDKIREVSSTFLHVPVLLKISTDRYRNIRPYLLGGVSYDFNFSSNQNNADDNSAGEFRMQSHNFMYEVGIGIDIYLYFFKFSPSIRGVFSISNELKPDNDPNSPWTAPINFFGTRGVFINFAFE